MCIWVSVLVSCLGAAILIAGGIVGWITLPAYIEKEIINTVKLENGTDQFERWETLPFPVKFKVYLWEVNNTDEILQGGKPDLVQKGPYVYNQFPKKVNIEKEGSNLTYRQILTYEFDTEDSFPLTEDDEITIFNLPYHAIIQSAYALSPILVGPINSYEKNIFNDQGVFLKTNVADLLWNGIPICSRRSILVNAICKSIASQAAKSQNMIISPNGTIFFSLFNHKNNTDTIKFKIDSGESNIKDVAKILEYNDEEHIDIWNNENGSLSICNTLSGTDGNAYPPFVTPKREYMHIFSTDICRTVTVHYAGKESYMGIKGLLYKAKEDMMPAASLNDDTRCYCLQKTPGILQENGCLKKGAQELYNCFESHMVLTHPHFMWADKEYQDGVTGMSPDPKKHEIFILVEPNTGSPLAGDRRVQFNMFLRRIPGMKSTDKLNTTLFPIVWVEEGIRLGDDMIDLLNDQLFHPLMIVDAVRWTLIGVGIVMLVIGVISFIITMRKRSHTTV